MLRRWRLNLFPGDGGGISAGAGDAGAEGSLTFSTADTVQDVGIVTEAQDADTDAQENASDPAAELAKAKADLAKFKAAIDKATAEAAAAKRELKKRQTAEEIAAEEKREADERAAQELDELRRKVAKAESVRSVMSKLGTNEDVSGKIADYLYGAEDVDAALVEIQRAWTAREKALKLEYGKIPPPGAGGANGEDEEMLRAIKLAKELGQERARSTAGIQDQLKGLIR